MWFLREKRKRNPLCRNGLSAAERKTYYADMCYADFSDELIFGSFYGYTAQIDQLVKMCKSKQQLEIGRWCKRTVKNISNYHVERMTDSTTDLCHLVLLRKDYIDSENKTFDFYLLSEDMPDTSIFFDKINSVVSVPMIKEWQDFIVTTLINARQIERCSIDRYGEGTANLQLWHCYGSDVQILNIVTSGLERHEIFINPNKLSSTLDRGIKLDAYLAQSSEHLATRIQEKFNPRFDPVHEKYSKVIMNFEDWCFNEGKGIQLFDAQKSIISAGVKCLQDEHVVFIVGEMGTGM